MKKLKLLIAIIFIVSNFQFVNAQKKEKDFRANAAFSAGEYFEAIDLYKTAYNKIKDKGRKTEIVYKIAECYRILREPRKAELWYKKAIAANFQDPLIFFRYA